MANPSTGFGGAGTEVLRRAYADSMTNNEVTLLTGVANHILTVLTVIFTERSDAVKNVRMYVDADLSGNDIYLLEDQEIPATGTFVYSDRFVLTETDKLHAKLMASGNVDVWISYIDQQLA